MAEQRGPTAGTLKATARPWATQISPAALVPSVLFFLNRHLGLLALGSSASLGSISEQALALVKKMTLEEKTAQLYHPYSTTAQTANCKVSVGCGALPIHRISDASTAAPLATVQARNQLQAEFLNGSRLGIPLSFTQEALHSGAMGGTVFPQSVALGASWDVDLTRRIFERVAADCRAVGADMGWSPVINLFQDPRFGRLQEGFSEDPLLPSTSPP